MAWTIKNLAARLQIDESDATKIIDLQRGNVEPETYATVSAWVRSCYNRPERAEMLMYAFNEILEGYGIEGGCRLNGDSCDFSYVNFGDTYATTIIHDTDYEKFRLMSWGDFIEKRQVESNDGEIEA